MCTLLKCKDVDYSCAYGNWHLVRTEILKAFIAVLQQRRSALLAKRQRVKTESEINESEIERKINELDDLLSSFQTCLPDISRILTAMAGNTVCMACSFSYIKQMMIRIIALAMPWIS